MAHQNLELRVEHKPFYKTYPKLPKSRHIWTAIILVFISCFIAVLE